MKIFFILIIFFPLLNSCVSQAEGRRMDEDIARMTTKYEILNRKLKNNQTRIDTSIKKIDDKLVELEKTLDNAKKLLRRNNANFDQDFVSIESNIQKMNGKNAEILSKFEKLNNEFDELKKSFNELRGNVTISSGENKNDNSKTDSKTTVNNTSSNQKVENVNKSNVNSMYSYAYAYVVGSKGKELNKKDRLLKAIDLFNEIVKKYPASTKANSAKYWITQCYFAIGDYKESYKSMNKFVNKFPKSKHIPQILFQMGVSLNKLNLKKDSKKIFDTLIKLFPNSSYSSKAKNYK